MRKIFSYFYFSKYKLSADVLSSYHYLARRTLTISNIGNLTKDVVSTDLFITLWWADKRLADHSDIDFGTNTPISGLKVKQKCKCKQYPSCFEPMCNWLDRVTEVNTSKATVSSIHPCKKALQQSLEDLYHLIWWMKSILNLTAVLWCLICWVRMLNNKSFSCGNLTAALSWSTEKLHTSHVSGSFSFVAKIFRMADR